MSERVRHIFVLSVVTILVLVSLLGVVGIPGVVKAQKTRLGLDLKGGTQLTFKAVTLAGKNPSASQLSDAINIMRSRINQIGTSGNEITSYGGNEITVSLPDVQNSAQAAKIVGVAGQLYFYDWEESVIGPNGQPAGPNQLSVTCGSPNQATASCGIPYYTAVIRASKQPEHVYPNASDPATVYYYVNDKAKKVYPVGPEPTLALLNADVAQHHVKLAAGTRVVAVKPGTVVIQATSTPGVLVPNDYYVLRDKPILTGKQISNPQENTDPTNGVVVTFGFKGNGGALFESATATLANRGKDNSPPGGTNNFQHFAVTLDGALVVVPFIDYTQNPNGINTSNGSEISGGFTFASATTLANTLASGALPVKLNEISSRTITATLGHQALNQGLIAGLVGLALVVIFLLVFYR